MANRYIVTCILALTTTISLISTPPVLADHKASHAMGVSNAVASTCPPFLAEKINAMLDTGLIGLFGSSLNSTEGNTRNNPSDCKITSSSFVYSVQIFTGVSQFGSFPRSGVNFAANSRTEYFSDHLSTTQAKSCALLVACDQY